MRELKSERGLPEKAGGAALRELKARLREGCCRCVELSWPKARQMEPEEQRLCLAALSEAEGGSVDVNAIIGSGARGASLLCAAAAMGADQVCARLLALGADPEAPVRVGPVDYGQGAITALGVACLAGFDLAGAALARGGANPMAELMIKGQRLSPAWLAVHRGLAQTLRASVPTIDFALGYRLSGMGSAGSSMRWDVMSYAALRCPGMFELMAGAGAPLSPKALERLERAGVGEQTLAWAQETYAKAERAALDLAVAPKAGAALSNKKNRGV